MEAIEPGKGRAWIGAAGDRVRVELRDDETPVGTFELDTRSLVRLESALDNGLDDDLVLPSGRLTTTWYHRRNAVRLVYAPSPRDASRQEFDVTICSADAAHLRSNLFLTYPNPPRTFT